MNVSTACSLFGRRYLRVHHLSKAIVLLDSNFNVLQQSFIPFTTDNQTSLDVNFYLPNGFEFVVNGEVKCIIDEMDLESHAVCVNRLK